MTLAELLMPIQIRRAERPDSVALAELLREIGWFPDLTAESRQTTATRVRQHLSLCLADDSHSVYVAVSEQKSEQKSKQKSEQKSERSIVGYIAVHWLPYLFLAGPEGFISELFVQSTMRGQGIGRRLLDTVKAEAKTRGCVRLMLVNSRDRDSYQRDYYTKQGWQERTNIANFVYLLS